MLNWWWHVWLARNWNRHQLALKRSSDERVNDRLASGWPSLVETLSPGYSRVPPPFFESVMEKGFWVELRDVACGRRYYFYFLFFVSRWVEEEREGWLNCCISLKQSTEICGAFSLAKSELLTSKSLEHSAAPYSTEKEKLARNT